MKWLIHWSRRGWAIFWLLITPVMSFVAWMVTAAELLSYERFETFAKAYQHAVAWVPWIGPTLENPVLVISVASATIGFYCLITDWISKQIATIEQPSATVAVPQTAHQPKASPAAPKEEAIIRWVNFKTKLKLGKKSKWRLGDPQGQPLTQTMRSNVEESPHGSALEIDTGTNSIVHNLGECLNVSKIEFILQPIDSNEEYIDLRLSDKHGKSRSMYRLHINCTEWSAPPERGFTSPTSMEWDICVQAEKTGDRGWVRVVADIDDLFSKTFAADGYRLVGIVGVHLRGKMQIAAIRLYGRQSIAQTQPPPMPQPVSAQDVTPLRRRWIPRQIAKYPKRSMAAAACLGLVLIFFLPASSPPPLTIIGDQPKNEIAQTSEIQADEKAVQSQSESKQGEIIHPKETTDDGTPAPKDEPNPSAETSPVPNEARIALDEYLTKDMDVICPKCRRITQRIKYEEFAKHQSLRCPKCTIQMNTEPISKPIAGEITRLRKAAGLELE